MRAASQCQVPLWPQGRPAVEEGRRRRRQGSYRQSACQPRDAAFTCIIYHIESACAGRGGAAALGSRRQSAPACLGGSTHRHSLR